VLSCDQPGLRVAASHRPGVDRPVRGAAQPRAARYAQRRTADADRRPMPPDGGGGQAGLMTDLLPARAPIAAARRDPLLLAGPVSVAVFLVQLVLTYTIAYSGPPPTARVSTSALPQFVADHSSASINALGQALSALALVLFVGALSRAFRHAAPHLLAAGALAAGTLLLAAVAVDALTWPSLNHQPQVASALFNLSYLIGGSAHVTALGLLVAVAALAGRRSGLLPRWLATYGLVVGAVGVLSVLNLGVPLLPDTVIAYLIPAGRFLGFVFIVASALILYRRPADTSV
jgi:hypothetical protein